MVSKDSPDNDPLHRPSTPNHAPYLSVSARPGSSNSTTSQSSTLDQERGPIIDDKVHIWRPDKRRWRDVRPTPGNLALQAEQIENAAAYEPPPDEAFANVTGIEEDSQSPEKTTVAYDSTLNELDKITLGYGYMDVRQISLQWDSRSQMQQRPVLPDHVTMLANDFKMGIDKVPVTRRLHVSISRAALEASARHTDQRLALPYGSTMARVLASKTQHFESEKEFTRLVLAKASYKSAPVVARAEGGQHRILALRQLAENQKSKDVIVGEEDLVSDDATLQAQAALWYGWPVRFIDADEAFKPENARALTISRRNAVDVKAGDSPGTIAQAAIKIWRAMGETERKPYEKNLKAFFEDFFRIDDDASLRYRGIFRSPSAVAMVEKLTSYLWGRDLFTQQRLTQLVNMRMADFVHALLGDTALQLGKLLDPSYMDGIRHGIPNSPVDAAKHVSLAELEALNSCFSRGRVNHLQWQSLFLPHIDDKIIFKSLPTVRFSPSFYNNDQHISQCNEIGRQHRRPSFLTFLNNEQYYCVFRNGLREVDPLELTSDPYAHETGSIVIPTKDWFKDLCQQWLHKFHHVLRFHWCLAEPQKYHYHVPLGTSGSGSSKVLKDLDIEEEFRRDFAKHRRDKAAAEFDREIESPFTGPIDEGNENSQREKRPTDAERQQQRSIARNNHKQEAIKSAHKEFSHYLTSLWSSIRSATQDLKGFQEACLVDNALFTQANTIDRNLELLSQILKHPFLRPTFEHAFFPHLGKAYLKGGASLLGQTNIGGISTNSQCGHDFFDLPFVQVPNAKAATVSAINSFSALKGLAKPDKEVVISQLQPFIDVAITSIAVQTIFRRLKGFHSIQNKSTALRNLPMQHAQRYEDSSILNYASLVQQENQLLSLVRHLTEEYKLQALDKHSHNIHTLLELSCEEMDKLLPHTGHIPLTDLLFTTDVTTVTPRILTAHADGETIGYAEEVRSLLRKATRNLPFEVTDAQKWAVEKEAELLAGREKQAKREANRTGVVSTGSVKRGTKRKPTISHEVVSTSASEDDATVSDRRAPKRPRAGHIQLGPKPRPEKNPSFSPSPGPTSNGVASRRDMSRQRSGDQPSEDDKQKFRALVWTSNADGFLPVATENAVYDYLHIKALNEHEWASADSLPGSKSAHTARAKRERVQLLQKFALKLGVQWRPISTSELPKLHYLPEDDYRSLHKQTASKPEHSSGPNMQSSRPVTPKTPRSREPSTQPSSRPSSSLARRQSTVNIGRERSAR